MSDYARRHPESVGNDPRKHVPGYGSPSNSDVANLPGWPVERKSIEEIRAMYDGPPGELVTTTPGERARMEAEGELALARNDAQKEQEQRYIEHGPALVAALKTIASQSCDHGAGAICPRLVALDALTRVEVKP